ncbi:hypothetical protein [Celeribacter arenosi]|uniref:Uncharacterized protein n=1 Tax=Celeribacter arenosi TaxID=792649 RepID=A0ABP7KBJ2_9RHOB
MFANKNTIAAFFVPVSLALAFAIAVLTQESFAQWTFARHANILSWYVRPLLLLPLCYAAWKRSWAGVGWSIFAMITSMAWFPVPDTPRPEVIDFLEMEKALLAQGWNLANILGLLAVVGYGALLIAAFWRQSWKLGLGVAAFGAVGKSLWSVAFSPESGTSVLPFAAAGFAILVTFVFLIRAMRR